MTILVISLAPVAVIAAYIYFRDKYEKEPVYLLLLSLFCGALITIPVVIIESYLSELSVNFRDFAKPVFHAFVIAGFTEEIFKYFVLFILIWKNRAFNEKFDGIVYAVFISLGFAGVENVLYVAEGGNVTGLIRAFTAVPAHAIFGITMGFFFGYAKFYPKQTLAWKFKAIAYPVVLHGIYDFILMSGIGWLTFFFIAFVIYLYISALRKIKSLSNESIYNTDFKLLEQKFNNKNNGSPAN